MTRYQQGSLFDDLPGGPTGALTPAEAARLYVSGLSACQIRAMYPRMTVAGVEARIRDGGRAGLVWCPVCRRWEVLTAGDG